MNLETIVNQFETRAGTLLRYYTGLLEHSKVQPCCFKLYNDPFDMAYDDEQQAIRSCIY